jgi:hypothetical protein
MIYAQKAFEMLDRIGWNEADTVLGPLVPTTVLATRYDRLPYMRKFLRVWGDASPNLTHLLTRQNGASFDARTLRTAILDEGPEQAFEALHRLLLSGVDVHNIIDAVSLAAAERFRRFNIELDTDDTNEWGWLDVTHTMTYLNAYRWAWSAHPTPDILRGLFHAVWFVQWTQQFDTPGGVAEPSTLVSADSDVVLAAIRARDPEQTVAAISGFNGESRALSGALAQAAAEDNSVAPIMIAHTVKTSRAAIVESSVLGDRTPLIAAGRFLASPKRERFVYNATLEAIDFIKGRSKGDSS